MTTESKELAFMPPKETAMVVFTGANSIDPYLAHIRAEIDAFVPDLTTKKGRDAIASMAYKVSQSKSALEAVGKALADEAKEIPKKIDATRKHVKDTLDSWRDEVRKPLDDWESEQKAIEEKRLADKAEAERIRLAEIAAKEKAAIEMNRKQGRIDDKSASEAMAQADLRRAEREHQERLKKFKGEGGSYLAQGGASAATFSARSLVAMGTSSTQSRALVAAIQTQKAIEAQTAMQKEQAEKQLIATKQNRPKFS